MAKISAVEKAEAIERLKTWVKDGDVVYCILVNCSRSGMSRVIRPVVFRTVDNHPEPYFIGFNVSLATGYGFDKKREGVRVNGCGMDMGFALVNDLARTLGIKLTHRWL